MESSLNVLNKEIQSYKELSSSITYFKRIFQHTLAKLDALEQYLSKKSNLLIVESEGSKDSIFKLHQILCELLECYKSNNYEKLLCSNILATVISAILHVNSYFSLSLPVSNFRNIWIESIEKVLDWVEYIVLNNFESSNLKIRSQKPNMPIYRNFNHSLLHIFHQLHSDNEKESISNAKKEIFHVNEDINHMIYKTVKTVKTGTFGCKCYVATYQNAPVLLKRYHYQHFKKKHIDMYQFALLTQNDIFKNGSNYLLISLGVIFSDENDEENEVDNKVAEEDFDAISNKQRNISTNSNESGSSSSYGFRTNSNNRYSVSGTIATRSIRSIGRPKLFDMASIVYELAPYGNLSQFLTSPPSQVLVLPSVVLGTNASYASSAIRYAETSSSTTPPASSSINITKQISPEIITSIAFDITCALEYLHTHYGAHQHLHPHNVLIFENYRVKLADFDCGLQSDASTSVDWKESKNLRWASFEECSYIKKKSSSQALGGGLTFFQSSAVVNVTSNFEATVEVIYYIIPHYTLLYYTYCIILYYTSQCRCNIILYYTILCIMNYPKHYICLMHGPVRHKIITSTYCVFYLFSF